MKNSAKKEQFYTTVNFKDEMDVYLSSCDSKFTPEQNLCCEIFRRAIKDVKGLKPNHPHRVDAVKWLLDIHSVENWSIGYVLDQISRTPEQKEFYLDFILKLVSVRH